MRLRLQLTVALLGALAACGDDSQLEQFRIQFALDAEGIGATCQAATCGDYSVICNAVVSVRLLDLALTNDDEPAERSSACVRITDLPNGTLCDAGDIDIQFQDVPREPGMIEVVIWAESEPGEGAPACPRIKFATDGRPHTDQLFTSGEPAFARRQPFDFSGKDGDTAIIDLACWQPALLAQEACFATETYVNADIGDLSTLLSIDIEQAEQLLVSIGEPAPDTDSGGYEIVPGQTFRLALAPTPEPNPDDPDPGFAPVFEATVRDRFDAGDDVCVIVDVDVVVPSAVTCQRAAPVPVPQSARENMDLSGFMLRPADLQRILQAIGLESVPPEGIVIGRTVQGFLAMDGVTVEPQVAEIPPTIHYLNGDLSSSDGLIATSASGFFVAVGVPHGTEWEATRAGGWHGPLDPRPRAGNISGRVTLLLLRMSQD